MTPEQDKTEADYELAETIHGEIVRIVKRPNTIKEPVWGPAVRAAVRESHASLYAHPSSRDDVLEEAARIAESRAPLWEEAKAIAAAIRAAKGGGHG